MIEQIEYKTTFEHCKRLIYGVCSHCGGELEPIETVDNSNAPTFWAGCKPCSRFDWGVLPEVYSIAEKMVDDNHYLAYSHMDSPRDRDDEYKKYYRESQIGGTTSIVAQIWRLIEDNKKALEGEIE